MPELFAVPFPELSLDDLASFLAAAEPEPLLWEAKGGSPNAHEVRRQCGGFANSERGGYVILGAAKTAGGWALNGMAFPDGEPHRYVTTCLQEGVRPIPSYDVRSIEAGPDRHVAIIEVQPLGASPCIVRGTVYERVAGATIPVKDPARLADLFARGERAHSRARQAAANEAQATTQQFDQIARDDPEDEESAARSLFVLVTVAPVVRDAQVALRLFRESTRTHMLELIETIVAGRRPLAADIWPVVTQHRRIVCARATMPYETDWVLSASWDGAVGVGMRGVGGSATPKRIITESVVPAFETAVNLVRFIGGADPAYVDVRVVDLQHPVLRRGVGLSRGPHGLAVGALDVGGLERELSRALGIDMPEPDLDDV